MIAAWLLYGCAIGALLAAGAFAAERLARLRVWPTRWAWLGAIIATVCLPLVLNLFPTAAPAVAQFAATPAMTPGALAGPAPDAAFAQSLDRPLMIVWLGVSLLLGVRMLAGLATLRRRRREWRSLEVDGQRVLVSNALGPATLGWARPVLVMPRWALELDDTSRHLIMAHEREHARNRDGVLGVIANVAVVFMPWNPALWWARHRLRLAIEIDCDERVLASGVDRRRYASLLLTVGARVSATPFTWSTAFAGRRSHLEHRIVAMTTPVRPRHPRLIGAGLGAIALAAIIVACESPSPDPISPRSSSGGDEPRARAVRGATAVGARQRSTWATGTGDTVTIDAWCPSTTAESTNSLICVPGDTLRLYPTENTRELDRVECAKGSECRTMASEGRSPIRILDSFSGTVDSARITVRSGGNVMTGNVSGAKPYVVIGVDTVTKDSVTDDGQRHRRRQITETKIGLPRPNWAYWSPDGRTVGFDRKK